MSFVLSKQQFSGKVKAIKGMRAKLSAEVQTALIAATYLTIVDHNCAPFQQILDAVGTTAHRQGVTQWAETYAPVLIRDGKFKLNGTAYKGLDAEGIKADPAKFDALVAETGMAEVKWDEIAKDKNTAESIFDASAYLTRVVGKLDKEGMGLLASMISKTVEDYNKVIAKVDAEPVAAE